LRSHVYASHLLIFFLFTAPAPPEIYTLSLHDALPISRPTAREVLVEFAEQAVEVGRGLDHARRDPVAQFLKNVIRPHRLAERCGDRKSTRLNSSHVAISYAVFCLKKKNI